MNHHARIAQQRIQTNALSRRDAVDFEGRLDKAEHEQQKAFEAQKGRAGIRHQARETCTVAGERDRGQNRGNQRPEQQAAFLPAIERRDDILERHIRTGAARDVGEAEVVGDKGNQQHGGGYDDHDGHADQRPHARYRQFGDASPFANNVERGSKDGQHKRQQQRAVSKQRHRTSERQLPVLAESDALKRDGHFVSNWLATSVPSGPILPSATTSTFSEKISGTVPL